MVAQVDEIFPVLLYWEAAPSEKYIILCGCNLAGRNFCKKSYEASLVEVHSSSSVVMEALRHNDIAKMIELLQKDE